MLTWGGLTAAPSSEGKVMKYVILKSCVAAGATRKAGEIVELGADEAASLKAYGRVAVAPEPKPTVASTDRAAKPKTTRAKK
jgi:hypothetical protein